MTDETDNNEEQSDDADVVDDMDWEETEDDLDWGEDDEGGLDWADDEGADDIDWADDEAGDDGLAWADDESNGTAESFPGATDESAGASQQDDPLPAPDQEADDEMDEAFDDMAVDDVETDEVWSDVAEEEEGEMVADDQQPDERTTDSDVTEVSKHDYCEGCEYLSDAPEIRCTHDGTEILAFTDMETVRLSNCPIVAERQGLEQGVSKGSTDLGEIQRE